MSMEVNSTLVNEFDTTDSNSTNGIGLQSVLVGNILAPTLSVIVFYLLVALIVHHRRSSSPCTFITVLHICIAVSALLGTFAEQIELQLGTNGDIYCLLFTIFIDMFYFMGILSTFTLFWLRQRSLYSSSLLRAYNGKIWRWVSTFIIVGIYGAIFPAAIILPINIHLQSSEDGCIMESAVESAVIAILVLVASAVFFQIALLILIIYPLRKASSHEESNNANQKRSIMDKLICSCLKKKIDQLPAKTDLNSNQNTVNELRLDAEKCQTLKVENDDRIRKLKNGSSPNCGPGLYQKKTNTFNRTRHCSQSESNMEKSTKALVRRLVLCTAVCITSELLAGAIAAISLIIAPDSYWSMIAQVDVLVNLLAVTFSFVNWKERLFPFRKIQTSPTLSTRTPSDAVTVTTVAYNRQLS